PEPEVVKKPFPWWIIVVIVVVVVIGGVVAFLLARGEPELAITAAASAEPVIAGQDLTYTITISNTGSGRAEGVVLTDTLPAGVTFVSASTDECQPTQAESVIACQLSEPVRENVQIDLIVAVDGSTRGIITNTLLLRSADTESPEEVIQSQTATSAVGQVALAVEMTGPGSARADQEIMYQVLVNNGGPSHARDVVVTYARPAGILGASAASSKGNCSDTGTELLCELGGIEADASLPVTITVVPGPAVVGTLDGVVTVTDSDGSTVEAPQVTTQVESATGLALAVNPSSNLALLGEEFQYTVSIWNNSPLAANDVQLSYTLPEGWEYVSTEPECAQQLFGGQVTLLCNFGSLPADPGDVRSVVISLLPTVEGATSNTFLVSSANLPDAEFALETQVAKAFSSVGLHFDGVNDWIELQEFNVPESFTVEMWINPETSRDQQSFIGKHTAAGDNIFLIGYWDGGLYVTLNGQTYTAGTKATGLYHLAVVIEKRTLSQSIVTVYQNGQVFWDREFASVLGTNISGKPWVLGQDWDGDVPTDFFDGAMAEVRIWDHPRTQEQIAQNMELRLNGDEPGLVAYWPLTEQTGVVAGDRAGNGYDGALKSGPIWVDATPPADFGMALQLDGVNDYLFIPDTPSLDLTAFTISVLVRPTQVTGDWQPLVVKEASDGGTRNYGLYINPNTPTIHYSFHHSDCQTWRSYNSNASLTLNEWNHVVMTYDGNTFQLYINGNLDSSRSIASPVCQNDHPVLIGRELARFQPFAGSIDEVRIFNRALSADEILATLGQPLRGNETGLVGYWRFDESENNRVFDMSGNGNDGNLFQGPIIFFPTLFPIIPDRMRQ
ncbi:MAG: hypothetical protein L0332_36110, partial [Chloroflexi bacterium]|nr:hypothetical protein [Chloroflexota bacterium]MCI0732123.1 hypothetical protein [Chloroflexota bacterium]